MAIEKLKRHKSPGIDQIPAVLVKAGGRTIRSGIYKFIHSVGNKEELPLYLSIRRGIKQIVVIIEACHFCQ